LANFHPRPHYQQRRPGGHRPMAPGMGPDGLPLRVRMPHQGEILGKVTELFGGSRMNVQCQDNFTRMCRIPGKIRRKLLINPGDIVAITPWTVESNEKGDIAYRYTRVQAEQLRQKGMLQGL